MAENNINDQVSLANAKAGGSEAKRKRVKTQVAEWLKHAETIDANINTLSPSEREAYDYIRNVFSNPNPDMELLLSHQETLRDLGQAYDGEFGMALKIFAMKVGTITSNFDLFKELVLSNEASAPSLGGGTQQMSLGGTVATPVQEPETIREQQPIETEPLFEVVLESCGQSKLSVVKAVKELLATGLKEAKDLADSTPCVVKGSLSREEANAFKEALEDAGATVSVRGKAPKKSAPSQAAGASSSTRRRMIQGATWEGEFKGNTPVGKGKITYPDGTVYEGEWNIYGPHGAGVINWSYGEVWTADFENGEPVRGHIKADNFEYVGDLNSSGPHGHGKRMYENFTETGHFENGENVGEGKIMFKDGDWYEGGWNENGPHGKGTFHMKTANRVDSGEYRDGDRFGSGKMKWDDGSWYEGGWNQKGQHGFGTYHYTNGRVDKGQYTDGVHTGKGEITFSNGHKYVGTWSENANGDINGTGKYYYSATEVENGSFVDGNWVKKQPKPTSTTSTVQNKPKTTTTSTQTSTTSTTTTSTDDTPSASLNARNIIAMIITIPLLIYVFVALLSDGGSWWEALICALILIVPHFIFQNEYDEHAAWWSPVTLYGFATGICGLVYLWGSTFGDKPWYWFIGGVFWGIVGLAAIGIGTDDD